MNMFNQFKIVKFFSIVLVVMAAVTMAACSSTRSQEGTGEYVDDSVITTKVKAAILNEPGLRVAEINVETFKGIVQLSGFVSDKSDIPKAVKLTREISGVVSVKNDLHVK